jgi:hypothetical protein
MPLLDVVGKAGTLLPAQIASEVPKLNEGIVFAVTVTVSDVELAHWPLAGVKV